MDVPNYLRILWKSKWLLVVGALVAAAAAFLAGFQIVEGRVVPRTATAYTAETTLLVSSQADNMFQAVIPGQQLVEGQTQPETVDLASKAILYAYVISGLEMRSAVETQVGAFSDTDALSAVRRTTQPGGDEAFPGRYTLPILSVVGASLDPARAETIAQTAADLFTEQIVAEQDAAALPVPDRVVVSVLDRSEATEVEGSNPAIPVAITFVGVFLLSVAAAFIVAGSRSKRAKRDAARANADADAPGDSHAADAHAADAQWDLIDVPEAPTHKQPRRRRIARDVVEPVPADAEHEPAYTS